MFIIFCSVGVCLGLLIICVQIILSLGTLQSRRAHLIVFATKYITNDLMICVVDRYRCTKLSHSSCVMFVTRNELTTIYVGLCCTCLIHVFNVNDRPIYLFIYLIIFFFAKVRITQKIL